MFSPEWDTFGLGIKNLKASAKVTATVSDKKLATVKWDEKQKYAWVTAKKPCTVKVTLKVVQDKKTYKHVTTMKWAPYNNPLQSLKIGSKSYKCSYFDKNTQAGMKKQSGKAKVTVKLKKGYQLTGLGFSRAGVYKSIKNGSSAIQFNPKGEHNTVVFINYKDPKGNDGLLRLFAVAKDCRM